MKIEELGRLGSKVSIGRSSAISIRKPLAPHERSFGFWG